MAGLPVADGIEAVPEPTPCRASRPGACPVTRGTMSASREMMAPTVT